MAFPITGVYRSTVTCYGYDSYPGTASFLSNTSPQNTTETVFSYSASCPGYGCVIYEPYYLNYRAYRPVRPFRCGGQTAISRHGYATTPMPQNCAMIQPYEIGGGNDEYYNTTPEYDTCMNATYEESDRCDQYMADCDPATDKDCGNWIINDSYVKNTQKAIACRDAADRNRTSCKVYLKKVDPASMVMYRDNWTGEMMPAMRICEQHFTIPPPGTGNATLPVQNPDMARKGPVESLYCGILSLLGVGC